MNKNDKQIDELIDKALQEEMALPEGLSSRLEKQIDLLAANEGKRSRLSLRKRSPYWFSGIAATLLLCIGIFGYNTSSSAGKQLADTYSNPQEAALVAEKALLLMSQNLNKGISQVDNANQEIIKVNHILNKHLND
jgi:hypothetical protein